MYVFEIKIVPKWDPRGFAREKSVQNKKKSEKREVQEFVGGVKIDENFKKIGPGGQK